MTFDPTLNPGPVNRETGPPPPIDRYLASLMETLNVRIPGAVDDLHTAAHAAGTLYGAGVADALGRIVGRLGDLDAGARSDLVYLRRAVDDRHAAMLIELDAAHGDAAIHRHLLDEARVELAAATVDATTRLMALGNVRRLLTDVATFARRPINAPDVTAVDWFNVADQAVAIIDGVTANPGNGDEDEPVELTGRWAGDPAAPIYVTDPGHWAATPEPAGTIIRAEPEPNP